MARPGKDGDPGRDGKTQRECEKDFERDSQTRKERQEISRTKMEMKLDAGQHTSERSFHHPNISPGKSNVRNG